MFVRKLFWQVILSFCLMINIITAHGSAEPITLSTTEKEEKLKSDLKKYEEIVYTLEKHYADPINIEEMIIGSIKRMLNSLDPFSTFHDKDAFRDFQLFQSGTYSGIYSGTFSGIFSGITLFIYSDFDGCVHINSIIYLKFRSTPREE